MTSPTSLLRTALCTGCLLIPQVVFAQDQPDQDQPDVERPTTPEERRQPQTPPSDYEKKQQEKQKQTQQQGLDQGQGIETLTGIYDFSRKEIVVGLLGNARAESRQVKKLSAQMIRDHQKLDDRVVAMAIKQKMELQPEAQMTEELEELQNVEGAEFDRMFIDKLVSSHQQRLEELTTQLQDTQNKQLKPILKESRRMLQRHLQQAQRVQKQIGSMAAG